MGQIMMEERHEAAYIASETAEVLEEGGWNDKQKLLAITAMALGSWLIVGLAVVGVTALFA